MLVLLFVALCFILRGDLFYVLPCVILFLCFSVLLALRLPRLGKRELILVLFVRLFDLCLGRAAACDCGTPWTFLLLFFIIMGIMGDCNCDMINNSTANKMSHIALSYSLKQLIDESSNYTEHPSTLIDLAIVRGLFKITWTFALTGNSFNTEKQKLYDMKRMFFFFSLCKFQTIRTCN